MVSYRLNAASMTSGLTPISAANAKTLWTSSGGPADDDSKATACSGCTTIASARPWFVAPSLPGDPLPATADGAPSPPTGLKALPWPPLPPFCAGCWVTAGSATCGRRSESDGAAEPVGDVAECLSPSLPAASASAGSDVRVCGRLPRTDCSVGDDRGLLHGLKHLEPAGGAGCGVLPLA